MQIWYTHELVSTPFLILGNLRIPISNMMPKYVHISAIVVFPQFDTPFCTEYLLVSKAINSHTLLGQIISKYSNALLVVGSKSLVGPSTPWITARV